MFLVLVALACVVLAEPQRVVVVNGTAGLSGPRGRNRPPVLIIVNDGQGPFLPRDRWWPYWNDLRPRTNFPPPGFGPAAGVPGLRPG